MYFSIFSINNVAEKKLRNYFINITQLIIIPIVVRLQTSSIYKLKIIFIF